MKRMYEYYLDEPKIGKRFMKYYYFLHGLKWKWYYLFYKEDVLKLKLLEFLKNRR